MMSRFILVCTLVAAFSLVSTETALAQRGSFRVNQAFRKLGGGWSGGYHWRTPGYNVDYYNPYSQHNSSLKTGIIPQGSISYLARSNGDCSSVNPVNISSFDQIGIYHDSSSYNFMPTVDYSVAPGDVPSNVVDSEVDVDDASSNINVRRIPQNGGQPRNSILTEPGAQNQPVPMQQQPSPSDRPDNDDGNVSLWRQFDQLESYQGRSFRRRGR